MSLSKAWCDAKVDNFQSQDWTDTPTFFRLVV